MIQKIYISLFFIFFTIAGFAQRNIIYEVKPNETIEDIAKIYRVSPQDILRLNPDTSNGIRQGTLLIIPDSMVVHYSTQAPVGFKYHSVKEQETLFGLTHKYNITIDDLKRYNQSLYTRGLLAGDELTIPIFDKGTSIVKKGKVGVKKYVVKPQEGLWRIAQNHGISQEALEKLNPGITENLVEGQEIWVPDNQENTLPKRQGMVLYKVEKGEGFMSLERKFGLSEDELIAINPELKDGIKLDTEIWIPQDRFLDSRNQYLTEEQFIFQNSNKFLSERSIPQNVHHIAFILPFRLEKSQKDGNFFDLKQKLQNDRLTKIATDFYLGAKIAIDSLSKKGYEIKVQVFDSEASEKGIQKALLNPELENAQLIIGPFIPHVFNELSRNINSSSTALLVPLSNSEEIELNPNVYQTLPNSEYQKNAMIDYITRAYSDTNILVLSDGKDNDKINRVANSLPNAKLVSKIDSDILSKLITDEKENIIIVDSNDFVFLSQVVQTLHPLQIIEGKTYPIRLIALEKGSAFDNNNISNTQLSALHFTYPTVNKFSDRNNSFSSGFEKKYDILPNRYIIRGFDITTDSILRLGVSSNFQTANDELEETSYVENKFVYRPNFSRGGGYENKGVYIVEYNNLEIKELPHLPKTSIINPNN